MTNDDLDTKLADILKRSAALPPLDTTGLTPDQAVDATITQVVDTSPLLGKLRIRQLRDTP